MGVSVSRAPSHLFIKHHVYYLRMVVPRLVREPRAPGVAIRLPNSGLVFGGRTAWESA